MSNMGGLRLFLESFFFCILFFFLFCLNTCALAHSSWVGSGDRLVFIKSNTRHHALNARRMLKIVFIVYSFLPAR
jgi:hypothetical protein